MRIAVTLIFLAVSWHCNSLAQDLSFEYQKVEKLGPNVNSAYEESAPYFAEGSNTLFFTRALHPDNKGGEGAGQDIWMSPLRNETSFGPATNDLPELNNLLNNAVVGASTSGQRLYFLSTYQRKLKLQKGFSYAYASDGLSFSRPKEMPIEALAIKGDFYGGSVHQDGNILLISMDSKNSLGEEDLYVSFKNEDDQWSKPLHLGSVVNSTGFEISPHLSEDTKLLFFASNGHGGQGNSDIFYTVRQDSSWTNWSEPVNMGSPINSPGFDAFPFVSEEWFYFSSNREGGFSDIFRAKNEQHYEPVDTMRLAFQTPTYKPKNLTVKVLDENKQEVGSFFSDTSNLVKIPGLTKNKLYTLEPSHELIDPSFLEGYVLNESNEPVESLNLDEAGSLEFRAQPKEAISRKEAVPIPLPAQGAIGVFEFQRVPIQYLTLALVDSNELVSQYTMTDEQGNFAFAEAPENGMFMVQVLTELEYIEEKSDLYYTNSNADKLFKANQLSKGLYEFRQLSISELSQLSMLKELQANSERARQKEVESKGVFKYEDLPKEGVTLYLVDENDNIVDSVITDADGEFVFTKLRPDQNFSIRVAETEDTDLNAGGLIFFIDDNGNEVNIMEKTEDLQAFVYKPLSPELQSRLQLIEEEGDFKLVIEEQFVFTVGMFKYQNEPQEGISLSLLDADENVVETVTTDERGQFIFSMLRNDSDFNIRIENMDDVNMELARIFLVGNEGNIIKADAASEDAEMFKFTTLQSDYFFSLSQINEGATQAMLDEGFKDVEGVFRYENLPKDGVTLYLVDENDNVIDSVVTNEDGSFQFQQLARDINYSIRLAVEDEGFLDAASFLMQNEDSEAITAVAEEGGKFDFRVLPRQQGDGIAGANAGDTSLDFDRFAQQPKEEKHEEVVPEESVVSEEPVEFETPPAGDDLGLLFNNEFKMASVYFDFNSIRLSTRDRFRINNEVVVPARRSGQPVLLIGYSCNIGSDAENVQTSKLRANEIKQYLIQMGIPEAQIEISAEGKALDDEDSSYEARVRSRRVDIFHLAP